jgi:uncharacterized RDD family membrane protein YckC
MLTAEAEPITAILATRTSRALALLIDQVIGVAVLLISRVVALTVIGVVAWIGVTAFGIVQIILVSIRGQTIGKIIMKIAIVDRIDKVPPGFVRAGLIRLAPMLAVNVFAPAFALPYIVIDGLPIFLPARRCLHDYLAATIVIKHLSDTGIDETADQRPTPRDLDGTIAADSADR